MADSGVSRKARRLFTYAVVGGGSAAALFLALRGVDTKVAQTVADGLMTMVLAVACTYIGASAMDYTVGDRGAFHRGTYQPPPRPPTETGAPTFSSRAD
jgi:hypothetical protein